MHDQHMRILAQERRHDLASEARRQRLSAPARPRRAHLANAGPTGIAEVAHRIVGALRGLVASDEARAAADFARGSQCDLATQRPSAPGPNDPAGARMFEADGLTAADGWSGLGRLLDGRPPHPGGGR